MTNIKTIFLIAMSIFCQLIYQSKAASHDNNPTHFSTPSQASKAFHSEADLHEMAARHNEYFSHVDENIGNRPLRKIVAHQNAVKGLEFRKKADENDRLAKQLETNTVAGKEPSTRARTRSQTRKVAGPSHQ